MLKCKRIKNAIDYDSERIKSVVYKSTLLLSNRHQDTIIKHLICIMSS